VLWLRRVADLQAVVRSWRARDVDIDLEAFEAWLGAKKSAPQLEALGLVFACLQGDAAALEVLDVEHLQKVRRSLKKMNVDAALEDELMSWLRFELFDGQLATYEGKGDLTGFLRAIAAHEALKRLQKQKKEVPSDEAPDVPMPNAELAVMKGAYGKAFTTALETSFRSLELSERNLLRQYFLDGLSIDALAKVHSIHRATAARRVGAARERLTERVRTALINSLQVSDESVNAIITLSNLDESLGLILRRTRDP